MHFGLKDIALTFVSILIVLGLAVGAAVGAAPWLDRLAGRYGPTLTVLWAGAAFFPSALVYARLLRMIQPYREGVFAIDNSAFMVFWKYYQFHGDWTEGILGYVLPVSLRRSFYRWMGANLGRGVMISGKLVEAPLIDIGDYAFTGENSLITAHAIEGGRVTLERIVIGQYATVGAMAIVYPGVHIGDYATVAGGAVVTKGSKIGAGEIWGGVPARKIGERPVPPPA